MNRHLRAAAAAALTADCSASFAPAWVASGDWRIGNDGGLLALGALHRRRQTGR